MGTNTKTLNGQVITSHIWWCEVCEENVTVKDNFYYVTQLCRLLVYIQHSLIHCFFNFQLHLMVNDDIGETKFMLLDMVARGYISESATELLNGSFDEVHINSIALFLK